MPKSGDLTRRRLLQGAAVALVPAPPVTLATAPLELGGDWGGSPPDAAMRVIARTREVGLAGVHLVSDRQPKRLRVDDHSTGPPFVYLHDEQPHTAWIVVDIAADSWSQLAYQFGHELGHVLCNSWRRDAVSPPPCRWLEEAMVEAFSIRGLGLLASSWERDPPFPDDAAYGQKIRDYRQNLIGKYATAGIQIGAWFRAKRIDLEKAAGVGAIEGPEIVALAGAYAADPAYVADLGALNRWPERTALALEEYLDRWEASCRDLGAPGRLPPWLRTTLGLG